MRLPRLLEGSALIDPLLDAPSWALLSTSRRFAGSEVDDAGVSDDRFLLLEQ